MYARFENDPEDNFKMKVESRIYCASLITLITLKLFNYI